MESAGSINQVEEALVELLYRIKRKVDWSKFKGLSHADVFQHRVKFSAYEPSIKRFVEKLCNKFGIQSIPSDLVEIIDFLEKHRDEALDLLRNESI